MTGGGGAVINACSLIKIKVKKIKTKTNVVKIIFNIKLELLKRTKTIVGVPPG